MKKLLLATTLMIMTASFASACDCTCKCPPPCDCPPPPPGVERKAPPRVNLDEKLNLTDAQKVKAREIRLQGHKEIKPLFEQLKIKKDQKRALMNNTNTNKEQLKMIENLDKEIFALKHQIHEVQIKNAKEFESILTDAQKKTLENIKKEARRDFRRHHRPGPMPCPCPCHK